MKILLIGGGGREHALGWRFAKAGHEVLSAPGNPGLAVLGEIVAIGVDQIDELVAVAGERVVDLVVVGPEAPLVAGIADQMREAGIAVFGPGAGGAQLEGSKAFSKRFFERHGIRTSEFRVCAGRQAARDAVAELGGALVVKLDGLAAGKGVVVCKNEAAALEAIDVVRARFGAAADALVIERCIAGRELSVMAICDGKRAILMAQAEDHKQLGDGDVGPNTGGMGTVSPAPWATPELMERIEGEIIALTVAGLRADGIDYRGVLYAGLMVDDTGVPWLLEYNCRFGDPETQPLMMRLRGDLGDVLLAAAQGDLASRELEWDPRTSVCVVMASAGYPAGSQKGIAIGGLAMVEGDYLVAFHAGTARSGDELVTAGGRVLGVTSLGRDVDEARDRAYAAIENISFPGAQFRTDIGRRRR